MSQHHVHSTYRDRAVLVVAGWDRPLQYAFLTVTYTDRNEEEPEFIYSNMDDENALTSRDDVDYFIEVLAELEIPTPFVMWEQICLESVLGGSSRLVRYDLNGSVLSDSSQWSAGELKC